MLQTEELRAYEETLRRFAARVDERLFSVEAPDGDLSSLPALLAEAAALGLLADANPQADGYELGVWGQACLQEGAALSLLALSSLGEVCAGFAAMLHAQGLACLALDGRGDLPAGALLAAAFTPAYGVPLSSRASIDGSGLRLSPARKGYQLDGSAHFILSPAEPQWLVCFAQRMGAYEPEWACLYLPASQAALSEVDGRSGLRAARQYHLECQGVQLDAGQLLHSGQAATQLLARLLACDWLGQAAIALGAARRALRDSRAYTEQRYQGGAVIEAHASIGLLQGVASYDIGVLEALLGQYADQRLSSMNPLALLRWALSARLALGEHALRAVTNCLQTLGGYGYMADYGFEKRLRDVSTLKSLHGAPDQLRLYLNEISRQE